MIFEMDVTLFYRQLNLTFKIGRSGKKMYVVKDIAQLLSMVDEGVWHQYGRAWSFIIRWKRLMKKAGRSSA